MQKTIGCSWQIGIVYVRLRCSKLTYQFILAIISAVPFSFVRRPRIHHRQYWVEARTFVIWFQLLSVFVVQRFFLESSYYRLNRLALSALVFTIPLSLNVVKLKLCIAFWHTPCLVDLLRSLSITRICTLSSLSINDFAACVYDSKLWIRKVINTAEDENGVNVKLSFPVCISILIITTRSSWICCPLLSETSLADHSVISFQLRTWL